MSLLTLIITFLLEQLYPLSSRKNLSGGLTSYAHFFSKQFNAGQRQQGMVAWILAVVPLIALVMFMFWLFYRVHPLFALAFNTMVLYLSMGFRQFSHYFTDIHNALRNDDLDEARELLSRWCEIPCQEMDSEEVARITIEQALIASQRYVFGVMTWFVIFSMLGLGGAAGAVLYRLGNFLNARWGVEMENGNSGFGSFARQAFYILEWLPVRMSAITFAIVGDFEHTIHCWRNQASSWSDPEEGILLASGAGALGVQLGMPIHQDGELLDRPELGVGLAADVDLMQSAVGLVWRSVVFWMVVLLMMTLAKFLG